MTKSIRSKDLHDAQSPPVGVPQAATLFQAQILTMDGDRATLSGQGWTGQARRAVSCLVAPEPGDTVLASLASDGQAFITAILLRPDNQDAVTLTPPGGKDLTIEAETFSLKAQRGHLVIGEVTLLGRTARLIQDTVEAVAKRLSWKASIATAAADTYVRTTRGVDTVKADHLIRQADRVASQQSEQAILQASEEMRLDGKRIDMG